MNGLAFNESQREKEDQQLIRSMADQDPAAIGLLYDRYATPVYSLAMRMLKNPKPAEEVVVETFQQVWRQAHLYDPAAGTVGAWLMTTARRCIRQARGLSPGRPNNPIETERSAKPPASLIGAGPELFIKEERSRMPRALSRLPEPQRVALELALFEGLTQSEISERTGESVPRIKALIRLALLNARAALKPHGEGDVAQLIQGTTGGHRPSHNSQSWWIHRCPSQT